MNRESTLLKLFLTLPTVITNARHCYVEIISRFRAATNVFNPSTPSAQIMFKSPYQKKMRKTHQSGWNWLIIVSDRSPISKTHLYVNTATGGSLHNFSGAKNICVFGPAKFWNEKWQLIAKVMKPIFVARLLHALTVKIINHSNF